MQALEGHEQTLEGYECSLKRIDFVTSLWKMQLSPRGATVSYWIGIDCKSQKRMDFTCYKSTDCMYREIMDRVYKKRMDCIFYKSLEGLKGLKVLRMHGQVLELTLMSVKVILAFDVLKSHIQEIRYVEAGE